MNGLCCLDTHRWEETYYGYKCCDCGEFIPFGSEPWIDADSGDNLDRSECELDGEDLAKVMEEIRGMPKPKLRKPEWDTLEQKRARQAKRTDTKKKFAQENGFSSWAALETAILNKEIKLMPKIYLIEDNAGGLFVGKKDGPWYDVTNVQNDSEFADDAYALANNDLDNWTVDVYAERPLGDVVAYCVDGLVTVDGKPGRAASNYLRVPYPA